MMQSLGVSRAGVFPLRQMDPEKYLNFDAAAQLAGTADAGSCSSTKANDLGLSISRNWPTGFSVNAAQRLVESGVTDINRRSDRRR